ncbi:MAG: efflux RND transporter permease subunit [Planctomycetes bacterium]|nr:efflux RND transporter permease subunit [Planctomycetota bacterium]
MSLFMRYGGKVTELSDHVAETIDEMRPALPAGVAITSVYDQANLVRESLRGVRDAIVIGMLLAIAVLWIFLGSWRLTVVAGISIPLSVLATFAILSALHESLNLMSLGGIAVAIGLIIDDAIVVVENIARGLGSYATRREAVVRATREIVGAVVGSSLTTVVVFVPLVLLEGVVGQFFRAMAIALAVGILVSMGIALLLTPILSAGRLGPRAGERTSRAWVNALAALYERGIRRALRWPKLAALGLVIVAAVGVVLVIRQETGFLPQMDEGGFVLDYRMPVGTSLSETDANCRRIETILSSTPEVAAFSRRTGAELGFFATEQFTGDFLVGLKPKRQRERTTFDVIDSLRDRIAHEAPQIEVSFVQVMQDTINDLAGNPSPLEVKVFGSDYHEIQDVAERVAKQLESVPGVVDVASGVSFGSPEITYRVDAVAVARAGLTSADVEDQLRAAFLGEEATLLRQGERLVPVTVRYPDEIRRDPTWLATLPLFDSSGRAIPSSLVSGLEERTNVNELARENQQPMVAVTANIAGRDLGSVAADVRRLLARVEKPRTVRTELGGQVQSQERAFQNLVLVLVLAIGLVFLLLVAQFRSYRLPLVIFFTLPFSAIGGLAALRITDTELNIAALMGLVMLVGLVVKNGIILIE